MNCTEPTKPSFFDREAAAGYDARFAKLDAIKQCLHLLLRITFANLPQKSRILCVGVGTGAELIYLADCFPDFQFVATDPSAPMLEICRERAIAAGVAGRCTFHPGYLDSLPQLQSFDAATCILVSQFVVDIAERTSLFRQIAERLSSGGLLVSADLSADMTHESFERVFDLWTRAWRYAGIPKDQIEGMCSAYGRDVAVLPPEAVASLIASAGFESPTAIFQALLIRAWSARRAW